MTSSNPRRLLLVFAMLLLPTFTFAQEATVTGTVVDQTGGVLPGVTVTAVNAATGNNFLGVTDERGSYRVPVRVGRYRIMYVVEDDLITIDRVDRVGGG